jgi:hypothetical protein
MPAYNDVINKYIFQLSKRTSHDHLAFYIAVGLIGIEE